MDTQYLTEDQIEELYYIHASTLRALRERGIGPKTIEVGGQIVYPVKELESWLATD